MLKEFFFLNGETYFETELLGLAGVIKRESNEFSESFECFDVASNGFLCSPLFFFFIVLTAAAVAVIVVVVVAGTTTTLHL